MVKKIYELDTAGHMFSAESTNRISNVFRVSVVMKEAIDALALQRAVDYLEDKYYHMFKQIQKGLFWHYFDDNHRPFMVQEEKGHPCGPIDAKGNKGYAIKILYYHHRISLEVFHAVTDGGGANEFLKSLVFYYLLELGHDVQAEGKLLTVKDLSHQHFEDDFIKYFSEPTSKGNRKLAVAKDAFNIEGTRYNTVTNHVISGELSASRLKETAKKHGTTITGYLTSLMIETINENYYEEVASSNKALVITIPVNLRKHYQSQTLKNFFEAINISVIPKKYANFEALCNEVHKQLKALSSKENLYSKVSGNVSMESNLIAKLMPLPLKNRLIQFGFHQFGEKKKTMTISNLGRVKIPSSMSRFVDRFEFVLYPTLRSPINCAVVSFDDRLVITFSKDIKEIKLIKSFFQKLNELDGMAVIINTNEVRINDEVS